MFVDVVALTDVIMLQQHVKGLIIPTHCLHIDLDTTQDSSTSVHGAGIVHHSTSCVQGGCQHRVVVVNRDQA